MKFRDFYIAMATITAAATLIDLVRIMFAI